MEGSIGGCHLLTATLERAVSVAVPLHPVLPTATQLIKHVTALTGLVPASFCKSTDALEQGPSSLTLYSQGLVLLR